VEVIDIEETDEAVDLVERVCALDIGKAALTVCIRVPHDDKPGHRRQEVREHATTTRSLLDLAARLHAAGVTLVAMEATSDYWKPAFYLLEAEGSAAGCSTPGTSRTSPAAPRPTSWMRSGWPRWSSEACAGQASCRPPRSAGCGT
jgi:transposase